ncbi:Sucrose porin precursor [Cronobacter sakazakii]|nr:Sucrose porin precursor [Cronobacter sakazakii]
MKKDAAEDGVHALLGLHNDSFYGLREGSSKTALLYGHGLGAGSEIHRLRWRAAAAGRYLASRDLRHDATRRRLAYRTAVLAQSSKDRYVKGDSYQWATANLRLIQEINQNFELQYEGSYQYMDLRPKGYNDRNAVSGNFYKLTFAPTLKAGDVGEFLKRP